MRRPRVDTISGVIGLAVVAVAVGHELRLPPDHRTWHGQVLGALPYDVGRPTLARLRHGSS